VLECTLFRLEGQGRPLASVLVEEAVQALSTPAVAAALHLDAAGPIEWAITGIGTAQTERGRSKRSLPGKCYREAGWEEFEHARGRSDLWLRVRVDRH